MAERAKNERMYEKRYKTLRVFDHEGEIRCVYCGDSYTDMDHVPPISKVREYEKLDVLLPEYIRIPCCSSCNSTLGATVQRTVEERYFELKKRLAAKYEEALNNLFDMEDHKGWNPDKEIYCRALRGRAAKLLNRINYRDGIESLALHSRWR